MSIERGTYGLILCCDGCGDTIETRKTEFTEALAVAKRDGWKAQKVCDEWLHFCRDCEP